jgi:hypothetical protein
MWKRYIDDILCICKAAILQLLLEALNSYNKNIQFTYELEANDSLPYLDTRIIKQVDGSLSCTVYRKPTHSGRYLEFHSNNPTSHKKSVVSSLFHRALMICSNSELYNEEKEVIMKDLKTNGYPRDFILKCERDVKKKRKNTSSEKTTSQEIGTPKPQRICLPYTSNWSEQIARICRQFNLELTHRPMNKIRYIWGNHKCHLPIHKNINSVYMISCKDCNLVYFGESNNATRRLKEHEADFRRARIENSALATHALSLKHTPNFEDHKILTNDSFYKTRKFSESFFIQEAGNAMNKHPGSLPSIYLTSDLFKNF